MRPPCARLLAASLFFAGCARATTPSPTPLATASPPVATQVPITTAAATARPAGPTPTLAPTATQPSLFTPVTASDWQVGPAKAAVTLIVYGDFQSPFCASLEVVLARLRNEYPEDLRIVFRQYPLPQHDKARLAAQAAEAAGAQGKFWQMHDKLFASQLEWANLTPVTFTEVLTDYAAGLGLDKAQFETA